jgi:hypothetical protein
MPSTTQPELDRYTYPLLRPFTPVLCRGARELQVGFDQEPALILADVDHGFERLMDLLDGCHRLQDIRVFAQQLGLDRAHLDWVMSTLDDAGLLIEGGRRSELNDTRSSDLRVRLIGAGRLGKSVGELLVHSGIAVLYVVDNDPPDPGLYPTAGACGSQAEALLGFLGQFPGARVSVANHWTKPEAVGPHLTIIASDRLECDRVMADGLVRADQPHLILRVRAGGVLVGPLVLPGQSACLRCTDLVRRDADPAWPTLLPQLLRMRMPIAAALAGWASGVAAAQALAYLHGTTPETLGATMEISPQDYVTRLRSWSMHPGCGCGWGATAQWGP